MRESAATKAERLLVERRIDVRHRDRWQVLATVLGDRAIEHRVRWSSGDGWRCTCEAASFRATCSHVLALQHVVVVGRHS